nr:hypothetical protein [uncultured Undibacterium sp.]
MSNTDEKKLAGHRASVREHVKKFDQYPDERDKDFALKTISRVQTEIASLLKQHAHWKSSWEDGWEAPRNWRSNL